MSCDKLTLKFESCKSKHTHVDISGNHKFICNIHEAMSKKCSKSTKLGKKCKKHVHKNNLCYFHFKIDNK